MTHRNASPTPRRRRLSFGLLVTMVAIPLATSVTATGQESTPPPNTFSLRLEGYAVEANTFSTATAATPRSAYSFAKLNSVLGFDGERGLDMEARGANDQYAGLGGAVLFSGDVPTDGNNLPGYTQAFFPTFEGFSQISEKCAVNQTEAKETPECRDQDGAYALAKVVPEETRPVVEGIARNQGDDARGDARSHSFIEPQPDGSVRGLQTNSGSNQAVPGTPITVDSYVAEQTIVTNIGSATTDIRCAGQVSVGGQPVNDNKQLQQALAPLTLASDLRVSFEPPTEPTIKQLPGGAVEASCRGPRFTVFSSAQGGTGTTYTFGSTFAASGITENADFSFDDSGTAGGFTSPPAGPPVGSASPPTTSGESSSPSDTTGSFVPDETAPTDPIPGQQTEAPTPTEEPPPSDLPASDFAGPELIRGSVDTTPIAVLTGAAAALLPFGVWLLLGVTGSLARGLPALRLPPFLD